MMVYQPNRPNTNLRDRREMETDATAGYLGHNPDHLNIIDALEWTSAKGTTLEPR